MVSPTALFVELLVIGIGTAVWLALFLATILGYRFDAGVLQNNPALIGTLTAIVYVLGIVIDRLIRGVFISTVERWATRKVFTDEKIRHIKEVAPRLNEGNLSMEIEKFIRAASEPLASKIDYNRSRLRICRAWVLHLVLIGFGLVCWNARVRVFQLGTVVWLLSGNALFLFLTWRATCLLAEDHQNDLVESFDIVTMK